MKDLLVKQYQAGLDMVSDCVQKCSEEAWTAGAHPRAFWRIAYHALYYTHLYLMPEVKDFVPYQGYEWHHPVLWDNDERGVPPVEHPYTREDILGYAQWLREAAPAMVEALDLGSSDSGFPWYPMTKLEHQLVNIRHLGVHIGQLQERLYTEDPAARPRWAGST